jgi:hypothetical protein
LSVELIATKILFIRGQRVILDKDLASLYGVPVGVLNQAVKRNIKRFPGDFMYRLTKQEVSNLKSQIVISSSELNNNQRVINLRENIATTGHGGSRQLPCVFTEQGVAMLSSVLNSERAIQVNIAIMRAFVRLREILLTHKDLAAKIEALELKYKSHYGRLSEHDEHIAAIFEAIKQLMAPPSMPEKPKIGFK